MDAISHGDVYIFIADIDKRIGQIDEIVKLFEIERYCKEHDYSYEQRYEYRLKKAPPILAAFWSWLEGLTGYDKGSRLGKAIQYALNRRPYLDTYLEDGRCSLSNNLSENAIRPFTVGRKNWLFSDTPTGAHASARIYTMVEMAKAHRCYPRCRRTWRH